MGDIFFAYQGTEHQPEFYVSKSYLMVTLYSLNPIVSLMLEMRPNMRPKMMLKIFYSREND